jgi:hypothetical protein
MSAPAAEKKKEETEAAAAKKEETKAMMEAMEEDDEFEEFEPEQWGKADEEKETQQWMDNWDDALDDDFTKSLRAELSKDGH